MNREKNARAQPYFEHPVFNRWDVVPRGWYHAMPSKKLKRGQVLSMELCGQSIVLYRGEDGVARAMDAFCPHMGVDLGIGKVVCHPLRCYFHHWPYDETSPCI